MGRWFLVFVVIVILGIAGWTLWTAGGGLGDNSSGNENNTGTNSSISAASSVSVQWANESVYIWNHGKSAWGKGEAFLSDSEEGYRKSFGSVKPGGFAQLPIDEFRRDGQRFESATLPGEAVWVRIDGGPRQQKPVE